jgi:AraC-like DNA-binding protein
MKSEVTPNSNAPGFFSSHVSGARRFYLDLNPPKDQALSIVCGGSEHCTPDYAIHRPSFPFHSIEFVARGKGMLSLNGKSHSLRPGCLFSYGPGVRHDIATDPSDPMTKYFVNFSGKAARRLLGRCHLLPGSTLRVLSVVEIQAIFDELIRNGIKGTRYSAEICARLLECLMLKIAESSSPTGGEESLAYMTYQHCRQHIQEHFPHLKTLQQIAQECHVDGAYLCRLFQRYDHQSPYQYLLRLRMNQAAEALLRPGAMVKQVAEETGFSDPFHFSRVFKGIFGVSPVDFRKLR